jgi:cellulose synthase operon protein C
MSRNIRGPFRRTLPLVFAALLACAPGEPALSSQSASPPPALEVEYAGCGAVLAPGPVCVLSPERTLRLWVRAAPGAQIEIEAGGNGIDATGEPVGDGQWFSLAIPASVANLAVLVEAGDGRASWSLNLDASTGTEAQGAALQPRQSAPRDVLAEVGEKATHIDENIRNRHLASARETLDSLPLPPKAPAESRYLASYYRGLLAEKVGDYRSALAEVQKAVEIAKRVKLEIHQFVAEQKLALLLGGVGRFQESAQLFERLRRTSHAQNRCDEAQLLGNQAWSALLAREAGETFADPTILFESALEMYETCKNVKPEKKANVLINLALAHLKEGRTARAKEILAQAHELEPHPPLPHTLWWLDLEARIALREGKPKEALHLFDDLEELASETGSSDARLRAARGQAQAHQALGDQAAALEILRGAEALLDEESLQVPIHEGRETFMATRQALVRLHIEILLDQGRNAQALNVVRHARSRVLRQLERGDRLANLTPDQRARWEQLLMGYQERRAALEERAKNEWRLPTDQVAQEHAARVTESAAIKRLLDRIFLVLEDHGEQQETTPLPTRPGELILAYHPLGEGWVGFAADGKIVMAHSFELQPDTLTRPEELARHLLLPFRSAIAGAKRIRVLPSGSLQEVDFHALPFGQDVLLATAPVVYGLDLPVSRNPAQRSGRQALLVSDPRDDLPSALDEGQKVRKVLESGSRPWIIEELKSAGASAEAVQGRLAAADLLHYAGHATFSGFGGWESSLRLAEESQLTLGDLLALARVPAWVVLSACDAGQSSAETPIEGLGLANAFLLAGSQAVVASTRRVDDRRAPEFFVELYQQWDREPDLAVALQRAQLAWRKRNPEADWRSFRLFEP